MDYRTWWDQWIGETFLPVGQGVIHPEGVKILNPWMQKAVELNITFSGSSARDRSGKEWNQYNEFMTDYFGFSEPVSNIMHGCHRFFRMTIILVVSASRRRHSDRILAATTRVSIPCFRFSRGLMLYYLYCPF